ncbi:MAG: succinate dehydrogenase/fumarate reductase iron-sulfur subunit [Deltaproteobacteria bacterium]|nr:succinate dehydrogenase/fumarate reductase iron-sulfur subunit [Deltaproteobacteria bacterium]
MKLKLKIWRQEGPSSPGKFVDYDMDHVSPDMSFLEMLDVLNVGLVKKGETPVEFDHDCREGICGSCALMINGNAHGPETGTATCQLHMRRFKDGDSVIIEPWRAKAFPVIKDLATDRTAFDRIMAAGGFISTNTGNAPEANSILIGHDTAESAMDSAACIGCGACVAACKNSSAMLFVSAKVSHLAQLPQGHPERAKRVRGMVTQMDNEGFGNCSNTGACEAACPKEIKLENITRLNREMVRAVFKD